MYASPPRESPFPAARLSGWWIRRVEAGAKIPAHPVSGLATVPPFPKPRGRFDYKLETELDALREHKELRELPARRRDRLLLATWNIANFGSKTDARRTIA